VPIPDGDPTNFEAQAVNDENSDWVSNIISKNFKVDTAAKSGDVVINEVMWMGSTESSSDEWLELRNMTDHTINIGHWTIENAKHSGNKKITVPDGTTIGPHGFFLIAKYDNDSGDSKLNVSVDDVDGALSLRDLGNGNLVLRNGGDDTIDKAKGGIWPAGWHGILFHMSMERNNNPKDGMESDNWHTCVDDKCNNKDYWDDNGTNFGTPGAANLSVNDPSSADYDPSVMEQKYFDAQETAVDEEAPIEPVIPAAGAPAVNPAPATENQEIAPPATEEPLTATPPVPSVVITEPAGEAAPVVAEKPEVVEEKPVVAEKPAEDAVKENLAKVEEPKKEEAVKEEPKKEEESKEEPKSEDSQTRT
jgi:hypothetical protein